MLETKLGIDFGSTNLTIYAEGKGVVISEPSVVICDTYSREVIAMGEKAKIMKGKLPSSMTAITPMKDGIVYDYEMALMMLRKYLNEACAGRILKPSVLMCVPGNVSDIEKKALLDLITEAGAGKACFIDEALAAAVGAGVSLTQPKGTLVCDIGGGTSECAVVTMGNIAVSGSVRVGGNDLTKTIVDYIFHEHNIEVGKETADHIKRTVGTAVYRNEEVSVISGGKSLETGFPVLFEITSTEIYWVMKSHMDEILKCIKNVLQQTPPELVADLEETGIILSGGTANLYGLDRFIEWNTGIATKKAANPEQCAVLGLGRLQKNRKSLEENGYVFVTADDSIDEE